MTQATAIALSRYVIEIDENPGRAWRESQQKGAYCKCCLRTTNDSGGC
jgi:hypothetical protein